MHQVKLALGCDFYARSSSTDERGDGMKKTLKQLALISLLPAILGAAHARGPLRAHEGNTSGWHFMSHKERLEHQSKMRSFKTYDPCHAYQVEHLQLMQARAKAQGVALRTDSRDICEHLRPRSVAP
jgi:hypothetical protein